MATERRQLPVELRLARIDPEPWGPLDSLSFGRYFAFTQSPNWDSELIRSRLIARLGYAEAAKLEPDVWQADGDALPRLDDWGSSSMRGPDEGDSPISTVSGQPGSNAWVVSGTRSTTGHPLLASDPHLFPNVPALF